MFNDKYYSPETLSYLKQNQCEEAIFGMGHFWYAEAAFRDIHTNITLPGIISTVVGYSGFQDMTKRKSASKKPIGREVVKICFDTTIINYQELLNIFWYNIDPFDSKGQFCDRGENYTAAILYTNNSQLMAAKKSKEEKERLLGKKILTYIEPNPPFYLAESEDQQYKMHHPINYQYYRQNCARDRKLQEIWGKLQDNDTTYSPYKKMVANMQILEEA